MRISGGGRCNVTHGCFDPKLLIGYYPRGGRELLGPFHRFQPSDTIAWFAREGVDLKIESDGRVFPTTDSSETIINALRGAAQTCGVEVRTQTAVTLIDRTEEGFQLTLSRGEPLLCNRLLLASGSHAASLHFAADLGHTIIPQVPSLFTFNIPTSPLLDLAGISLERVHLRIEGLRLEESGPLLLTHWGFSGPAVLKLSAWGARLLNECSYQASLTINWLPDTPPAEVSSELKRLRLTEGHRSVANLCPFDLPRNLWKRLTSLAGIDDELRFSSLDQAKTKRLESLLQASSYRIEGKTTYKQEFVTAGGVHLAEVNFKTMESRLCPGLYFAGEVLDIDGITGGFNFQNAWTTGWIAGRSCALV